MAKRVRSVDRTELRKELRNLYLDQSDYLLNHSKPSTAINYKIDKAKAALAKVDCASIHKDTPQRPGVRKARKL
ncbi:hypothetical protein NYE25_14495 [Paenibacillus sp. FSL E2-8871]|uniref:hypothetical protein n=1 Tax=Paenibacillus sp. FSL E2-8871 TaxID=2975326 RepID=UPI0030F8856D